MYRARNGPSIQRRNDRNSWEVRVKQLFAFLQGTLPDGVIMKHPPKLSPRMAMSIIWFLQESTEVLPDNFQMCDDCEEIYDSYAEGDYREEAGRFRCGSCAGQD